MGIVLTQKAGHFAMCLSDSPDPLVSVRDESG